jgi:alpha-L-rhamnosidase
MKMTFITNKSVLGQATRWLAVLAACCFLELPCQAAVSVEQLRCEYRTAPLGLDAAKPRLSWVIKDDKRGQKQAAYQVLVASKPELLAKDQGDLWDSGKVASDQDIQVEYQGQPLASRMQCYWKVRVWDKDGKATAWSQPALWTMGLLQPADWRAKWIGLDEFVTSSALSGAQWIWFPEGNPAVSAPPGVRYFRRTLSLPPGRKPVAATCNLTADNAFELFINGRKAAQGDNFENVVMSDVTAFLQAGDNVLTISATNTGNAPNPAGLIVKLHIQFDHGDPLDFVTDGQWESSTDQNQWTPAKALGVFGIGPWDQVASESTRRLAARYLRKEFTVSRQVKRATAYFSGLGLSEFYVNGQKAGDAVLSPGLTDYTKHILYVTHDVTQMIREGRNAMGVILGNGRFYSPRTRTPTGTIGYGFPKLCLQLEVEYTDGTRDEIVSDPSWKLTTAGPIQANNEYDGEEYDARREMPGWNAVGFDDAKWTPAQSNSAPGGKLAAQMMEPIRVTGTLKPIAITEPKPGVFIFDMGQNMVGWCRLTARGPAGTTVSLRHAETLKPDGTLYLANIRGAKVTDLYTLKGKGQENYEPRFTYHGFRYVEVTGFPGKPKLASLAGRIVNDDVATAGEFACSQPTINRIYRNVVWGVRGNYRSIPTDCPQRDERQGWLGDRSAESKGEAYLFDIAALYAKWVQDMADSQKDNGSISDVCPAYWPLYGDNVTWPSSAVIIPGNLLEQYGDTSVVARQYPCMVKWIDHMSGFIKNGIIAKDNYGDWCVPPEDPNLIHSNDPARKTAPEILATGYFYHCLKLMVRYATLLDKPDDAARFAVLADQLKTALNGKFYNPEKGFYGNGSQTACVLPLAFDMVPDAERGRVFNHLVEKITGETKGHIGTGLIGGQWINRVLTDGGRADLVYGFATNTAYPSWGYMAEHGATTVWELWNGNTADPAMNSGNHVMLVGDFIIWLYEKLAGIQCDPTTVGFKKTLIKPTIVGDLTWVKCHHDSPHGRIVSNWKREGDKLTMEVTIPANTTATIYIPTMDVNTVTESGQPVAQAKGVVFIKMETGTAVYTVGAGTYQFSSTLR